jgi:hypothetical protein
MILLVLRSCCHSGGLQAKQNQNANSTNAGKPLPSLARLHGLTGFCCCYCCCCSKHCLPELCTTSAYKLTSHALLTLAISGAAAAAAAAACTACPKCPAHLRISWLHATDIACAAHPRHLWRCCWQRARSRLYVYLEVVRCAGLLGLGAHMFSHSCPVA